MHIKSSGSPGNLKINLVGNSVSQESSEAKDLELKVVVHEATIQSVEITGIVGGAGVCANAQKDIYVGMILILISAEALGLPGLVDIPGGLLIALLF